jgi:hypothetical protein
LIILLYLIKWIGLKSESICNLQRLLLTTTRKLQFKNPRRTRTAGTPPKTKTTWTRERGTAQETGRRRKK